MNHEQIRSTPYNISDMHHTTLVFLMWHVWVCACMIAHVSHAGLGIVSFNVKETSKTIKSK